MVFRQDIQILRGVAVLLVIVYHLFPGQLPSGYLGVDMFFVISGFLMAVFYKQDNETTYIKSFYRRRFHRILPAYFATIIVTILIGSIVLLPHEIEELYKESIAAITLLPNLYLWSGESYFQGIVLRPLLHTWSLGLELQFYLIVPIIFFIFDRFKVIYFFLFVSSLVLCFFALEVSAKSAFFLLPFRLWEFVFGFSVAFYFSNSGNRKISKPMIGMVALIGLVVLGFIKTDIGNHPGFYALLTCAITSAILICGLPRLVENSKVGQCLVFVGKYSYSLYLVHFPIISFLYYSPFTSEAHATNIDSNLLLAILYMVIATALSYHLFETNKLTSKRFSKNKLIITLVAFTLFVLPLSYVINHQYFDEETILISKAVTDRSTWRCGKVGKLKEIINPNNKTCKINDVAASDKGVLLVGDSHADALKISLAKAAELNGRPAYLMNDSCNLGIGKCSISIILEEVKKLGVSTIVLHDLYYNTDYVKISNLLDEKLPFTEVIFVEPVPTYDDNIPAYLYKQHTQSEFTSKINNDLNYYQKKYEKYTKKMSKLKAKGLITVNTVEVFCQPNCVLLSDDGEPYYFDSHHLTLSGASLLEHLLQQVLAINSY